MTRPNVRLATSASRPRRPRTKVRAFGSWYCQPHQDNLWRYLEAGGKRACAVWHRRAGKDDIALRWTCKAAHKRIGNYWHMLPQAEQARKAIWEAVNPHTGKRRIDEAFPPGMRKRTRNNEMMIELACGSIWQVVGSDNYNALVGSPPVGVVFSEWSLADPASWAYISPILLENDGWALFLYTPRGRNHGFNTARLAKSRSETWFYELLTVEQTGVFTAEEIANELAEKQAEYGPDLGAAWIQQEYYCSFDAAVLGAIYAPWMRALERAQRIGAFPPVPGYEIHTAWDIGYADHTAIWWYQLLPGPEVRLVDFYTTSGQGAQHYAEILTGKRIKVRDGSKRWDFDGDYAGHEHRQAYVYGRHFAPHDAAHHTIAANGRSFGDQMYDFGITLEVLGQVNQRDQIATARKSLEYCTFDAVRCARGIEALESYHYEWDEKLRQLKEKPHHDWSSHPADAYEIVSQSWDMPAEAPKVTRPKFLHEVTADEVFFPSDSGVKPRALERL